MIPAFIVGEESAGETANLHCPHRSCLLSAWAAKGPSAKSNALRAGFPLAAPHPRTFLSLPSRLKCTLGAMASLGGLHPRQQAEP